MHNWFSEKAQTSGNLKNPENVREALKGAVKLVEMKIKKKHMGGKLKSRGGEFVPISCKMISYETNDIKGAK